MWPEIEVAKTEKRREIVLTGPEVSERIKKDGLDTAIYQLTDLNYLSLTDTCLSELPSEISKLVNLQTLILHSNKLESFNQSATQLTKLKTLDLSRNLIETLPETIASLSQIFVVNISNNKLQNFPALSNNAKLSVLDLSNNNLTAFPAICSAELLNLSELKLHGNKIEEIPNNIHVLPALKVMDISGNQIKIIPGELAECHKLKDLNLKSNPISDRRLLKLIDQCRTKQIMDYIKQNCPKTSNTEVPTGKKGKKVGKSRQKSRDSENSQSNDSEEMAYRYTIVCKPSLDSFKIIVDNSVKTVREHIVCCLVNNVAFTESNFKDFIKLQNKLHDSVCEKRNLATIATHDFKKLGPSPVIQYITFPPNDLLIKPLNRQTEMTGLELFSKLQTEANNLRKEKKRSTYSGIHKYLYLIEGKALYPCVVTGKGDVISLPPITNSEISKIEPSTTQIFVEVTSSVSQFACKNVLTQLLKEMVNIFEKDLEVQQVKICDQDEKPKVVFPGKADLKFDENTPIKVVRE